MSFARLVEGDSFKQEPSDPNASREVVLSGIQNLKVVDVVVYGGTIEAATLARLCALSGLRVVMFSRSEWGAGSDLSRNRFGAEIFGLIASGKLRSTKRGLDELLHVAPHCVEWRDMGIELSRGRLWMWLAQFFAPALKSLHKNSVRVPILDANRFLSASILAARQEGVLCLEHSRVTTLRKLPDGVLLLDWADQLSESVGRLKAGVLFDAVLQNATKTAIELGSLIDAQKHIDLIQPTVLSGTTSLQVSENGAVRFSECALVRMFSDLSNLLERALLQSGSREKPANLAGRKLPNV